MIIKLTFIMVTSKLTFTTVTSKFTFIIVTSKLTFTTQSLFSKQSRKSSLIPEHAGFGFESSAISSNPYFGIIEYLRRMYIFSTWKKNIKKYLLPVQE